MDVAVVRGLPELSRAEAQRLIRDGRVRVDGVCGTRPAHPVPVGASVEVVIPAPQPADLVPEDVPIDVLYEDSHLLVVNKDPGIVVHPGAGHGEGTLVHALLHHCAGGLSGIGGVERPGIVHRLDRDTSGCIVVAKDDATHRGLATLFSGRSVDKRYLTMGWGQFAGDRFRVDQAIGRSIRNRQKMAVRADGREAVTDFRVVERFPDAALLEAHLLTGRTHQIRVHLAAEGHPVVGDRQYGRARVRARGLAPIEPTRQLLHAWRLGFRHPVLDRDVSVEAPLPRDFRDAVDMFRGHTPSDGPPESSAQ